VIGDTAPPRCLWFSATVAGPPTLDLLDDRREPIEEIRREVEPDVRYANIATIEGTGGSRYGNAEVERG
jgi:L-lactate dehydrogenase